MEEQNQSQEQLDQAARQNERHQQSTAVESGSNSDHQNASANRGGTTDMGSEALGGVRTGGTGTGSGMGDKMGVTGSDYDGQVAQS